LTHHTVNVSWAKAGAAANISPTASGRLDKMLRLTIFMIIPPIRC